MGNIVSQCMREPVQEIAIRYEGSLAELETSFITKSL